MKECKKRVEKIWPELRGKDLQLRVGYNTGWKDALEWALTQRFPINEDYAMRYHDWTPEPIDPELIEEELEQ